MTHRVLVIDDEVVTRRLVAFTLKALNIEVEGVGDGASALDILQNQAFDLVFVDINLPDIEGFDLMQQIRAIPEQVDLPMIPFTARNNPDDEALAQALGAVDFIYKPFSTQELRTLVSKHLNLE